jgi:hypothetical protein
VLLVALIIALVLGFTCASMVIFSAANATSSQQVLRRAQALTSAEIGVERAKAAIAQGFYAAQFLNVVSIPQPVPGGPDHLHVAVDSGTVTASNGNTYGNYSVYVEQNLGDLQEQYLIKAQGSVGTSTREVSVVVRRPPAQLPNLLGAITFYNPNGLANFSGRPSYVSGLDTNLPLPFNTAKYSDCVEGSGAGPNAVGVAVHDDSSVASIISAFSKNLSAVVGTDGTSDGRSFPSVYNVAVSNPTNQTDTLQASDIVALANAIAASPDCVYNGSQWVNGSGSPISGGNWGTTSAPTIVVIRPPAGAQVNLNGNVSGCGILVVDGQVKFGGTFNYAGLVMITQDGSATVDVEMAGTPLVMGSIVAANDYSSATSMLDLRGNSKVYFSREGLSKAAQALTNHATKFQTLFYTETPDAVHY